MNDQCITRSESIRKICSPGDVVVIKPNISWARAPQLAATTNPEVLEAVIELCREAGAKKIRIADNTIHDARRCFAVTGAGQAAKKNRRGSGLSPLFHDERDGLAWGEVA